MLRWRGMSKRRPSSERRGDSRLRGNDVGRGTPSGEMPNNLNIRHGRPIRALGTSSGETPNNPNATLPWTGYRRTCGR